MDKRPLSEVLSWYDFFMGVARLAAQRSKDPHTQVGACIVNQRNHIVGVGYNGFPAGISDDDFSWATTADDELDTKHPYVCHAEMNAVTNSDSDLRGTVCYVTLFPCNNCTQLLIQVGVKRVVYGSDKYADRWFTIAAKRMLDAAGIPYEPFL